MGGPDDPTHDGAPAPEHPDTSFSILRRGRGWERRWPALAAWVGRYRELRGEVLFISGFLLLIAAGTLLLLLPAATPPEAPIGFVDALFTSTSATCVTGLAVRDTGTGFTGFGHAVILALIQLGGLGIMTVSAFLLYLLGQQMRRRNQSALQGVFGEHERFHPRRLVLGIIIVTLLVEALGAALLLPALGSSPGGGSPAFNAVFHAVSATCNAGFSLYPDSLVRFRGSPAVNLVIMALIVLGGIGYAVIFDVFRRLRHREPRRPRLSLHTRLVLGSTALLLVIGVAVFLVLESSNALAGRALGERLWTSCFQSVTLRTAGFNTLEFAHMRPVTLFLCIMLMFVGGSPGSAAGGVKTTTALLALVTLWARARGQEQVVLFRRTIPEVLCSRALLIVLVSFLILALAIVALTLAEAHDLEDTHGREHFLDLMFEAVSAFATVGLSTGWTPQLSGEGRLILIALMFVGRVGPLSLATALGERRRPRQARYPEDQMMIG